jgi:hypothetical protein
LASYAIICEPVETFAIRGRSPFPEPSPWPGNIPGWRDKAGWRDKELYIADNFCSDIIDNVTFEVATSAVPAPAVVWLIGSGVIGLPGVAKRKN